MMALIDDGPLAAYTPEEREVLIHRIKRDSLRR